MTSSPLPRLLFFSTLNTTFIQVDKKILEKDVRLVTLTAHGVGAVVRIFFHLLRADIGLAWFASVYSFFIVLFSKILGKHAIIIVAGVDAARDREINYGIWLNPWKARLVSYAVRNARAVLVVDPFLGNEIRRLARYDGMNVRYVPFGFDPEYWKPEGSKESLVLTVAACQTIWTFRKKGLDKLFEAAKEMPDTRFVVVGVNPTILPSLQVPVNVEMHAWVDQPGLLAFYRRARVYCQVSFTEGMPNALCEAMLCGCIPVGTQRGGIPNVIGDAGFLVPYGDVGAMVRAFRDALALPAERGTAARRRIAENFPLRRRREDLLRTIGEIA